MIAVAIENMPPQTQKSNHLHYENMVMNGPTKSVILQKERHAEAESDVLMVQYCVLVHEIMTYVSRFIQKQNSR
jgi:hypothetical protein